MNVSADQGFPDKQEKGKAEGMTEKAQEVALGMLNKGYSLSDISDLTGLSVKEIERLR